MNLYQKSPKLILTCHNLVSKTKTKRCLIDIYGDDRLEVELDNGEQIQAGTKNKY